jgi:hypothetical protein
VDTCGKRERVGECVGGTEKLTGAYLVYRFDAVAGTFAVFQRGFEEGLR